MGKYEMNTVKNYLTQQDYSNVYDSHNQIPKHIGDRRITIENSTNKLLGVGIESCLSGTSRPIFFLRPDESKSLSVNSYGRNIQFIRIFSFVQENTQVRKLKEIGEPSAITSSYNQFVIRSGGASITNDPLIFIQSYYQASFRP